MEAPAEVGSTPAVDVRGLSFRYGERLALDDVTFAVRAGEIFALLGPNGGGKTTLFSLLATLAAYRAGTIAVFGTELAADVMAARRSMGVVFQSPSLDPHLTVVENLLHQGHLYGLRGRRLAARSAELLDRFELDDRAGDRVGTLSGGLRRRLEIAKALLHEPRLLILDEPSTGLDPGIRRGLWSLLEALRRDGGVTVLLTTHFMEEGDRCDRVGLLDRGRLAALGEPEELKAEVGGEVVRLGTRHPRRTLERLRERFGIEATASEGVVRFELEGAHQRVVELVGALSDLALSITVARPSLEDVFLRRTGRGFWEAMGPERA